MQKAAVTRPGGRKEGTEMPLYRSRKYKRIAGVCGGIAEWLGWDPTVVRIAYVVLSIASVGFPGTIAYIILWIVMPQEPV
jgi:phage shock protein C